MRALYIVKPGEVQVRSIPEPEPGNGDVLLRIDRVGLCGSDLSTYLGKNSMVEFPRIPGHEISAQVLGKGADVPDDVEIGSRVTVVPYTSCGVCPACLRRQANACRFNQTLGVQRDGAAVERLVVPWRKLVSLKGTPAENLVLVEPFTVGFHAVDRVEVTDADTVLVIGCGMIGIGAVARAALRGARVIAADIDEKKLEIAGKFGAAGTVNSAETDLVESIRNRTGGVGPDVVIEAVGTAVTYRAAVDAVAFAGRIACIGYTAGDTLLPTRSFVQKELTIRGSRNATDLDFLAVAAFFESRPVDADTLISRKVNLDSAGEALNEWAGNRGGILKIVIEI